ncbi:hypothetical protein SBOR_8229 [Sclerotinia borealis F-4128]|uniref:FAD dependent oxidoreductase domain-containing protein n=1 Tax=Sclerotinia borealis (strain F-4128) TaxID=1432307 RepID=W9C3Q3_SCLBF|nr:hypothetical protein SBOR_8229 [Sclerotinia borealis F-4128]
MTATNEIPGQAGLPTPNSTKSFWHREPSKILQGHRTTEELPSRADVVIIGSGIAGSSAAHWLREHAEGKHLNVVMLEAREACWGATGRNGGHCQPLVYASPPEVGAFEVRNYEDIKSFVEKNDIQCEWRSLSSCHSYMSEDLFEHAVKDTKSLKVSDPKLGDLVTIITKSSTNPSLSDLRIPTAAGAIITSKAASLWPYKLVSWILEDLIAKNKSLDSPKFNLQTSTPVTHLQKSSLEWIIHTPRGQLSTPKVLLATNAYTSHLLPSFTDLIVPVRGEMSSLLPPSSMSPTTDSSREPLEYSYSIMGHASQNINRDDYLVQRPFCTLSSSSSSPKASGGELMFGGGREFASQAGMGVFDDSSIDLPAAAYLRRSLPLALNLHNDHEELKASFEWSGIMGFSRDNFPWVGSVGEELGGGDGLYVCAGFTGHGMPTARLSAKAVVGLIMGEAVEELDLPGRYVLSMERVESARALDTVMVADEKGEYF